MLIYSENTLYIPAFSAVAMIYGVLTAFLQYFIPITVLAWVYLGESPARVYFGE